MQYSLEILKLRFILQGCRNVEEFSCLNRIEEGTYGVVYRARDKKTGMCILEVYLVKIFD
jgi:cell division cycle 2-like protein